MIDDGTRDQESALAYFGSRHGKLTLWFGFLAGPIAWFLDLMIGYSLVDYICVGGSIWTLHLTSAVAVMIAGGAVWSAYRSWTLIGGGSMTTGASVLGRTRFMALGGLLLSCFFLAIIVLAWAPSMILEPCAGAM